MAALPDLAGLYAALGMPVNLDGLAIEDVQAERSEVGEEGAQILVRGTIRNVSGGELPIPALAASFYDAARHARRLARLRPAGAPHGGRRAGAVSAGDSRCSATGGGDRHKVPPAGAAAGRRRGRNGGTMTEADQKAVRPIFSAEEIAARVVRVAREIAASEPKRLLAIIVLKGGFVFAADLVRALALEGVRLEIEFISLSSYGSGTKSTGEVRVVRDIEVPVAGRDVLIIDDVLDSGLTLKFARDLMQGRGARRVAIAAMIDKPAGRRAPIEADYVGFTCPDYFVVGYGMDAGHAYRELPFVGVLESTADKAG